MRANLGAPLTTARDRRMHRASSLVAVYNTTIMDSSLLQHRRFHNQAAAADAENIGARHAHQASMSMGTSRQPRRRRRRTARLSTSESPLTRMLVLFSSIIIVVLIRSVYRRIIYYQHRGDDNSKRQEDRTSSGASSSFRTTTHNKAPPAPFGTTRTTQVYNNATTSIPFVYLVYNRVNYMRQTLESLLKSDFVLYNNAPLIISHDGKDSQEMQDYIQDFQKQHPDVTIHNIFHPHHELCSRNETKKHTCTKHHFTWMLKTVHDEFDHYPAFLFMEEDYEVAPTIYQTLLSGMNLLLNKESHNESLFGITLDRTKRRLSPTLQRSSRILPNKDIFLMDDFVSGPMLLERSMLHEFVSNDKIIRSYCTFNDYNWDWSVVHVQNEKLLPSKVLNPSSPQVRHIGLVGMHHQGNALRGGRHGPQRRNTTTKFGVDRLRGRPLGEFHGTELYTWSELDQLKRDYYPVQKGNHTRAAGALLRHPKLHIRHKGDDGSSARHHHHHHHHHPFVPHRRRLTTKKEPKPTTSGIIAEGYGGWDDPADQQHCLNVLRG